MSTNTLSNPYGLNMCMGDADCDIGASAADFETNNAVTLVHDGVASTLAVTAAGTMTAAAVQAVSTSCIYLFTANSSGTIATVKGTAVTTLDVTEGRKGLFYPNPADGYVAFGAVRVDTDASTTFTAGTTTFSAAGITDTFISLVCLPSAPISS